MTSLLVDGQRVAVQQRVRVPITLQLKLDVEYLLHPQLQDMNDLSRKYQGWYRHQPAHRFDDFGEAYILLLIFVDYMDLTAHVRSLLHHAQ